MKVEEWWRESLALYGGSAVLLLASAVLAKVLRDAYQDIVLQVYRQVHKQQLFLTLACLQAVESAISLQLRAIESFKPDVVVAEDFGAGIATWLLHRGLWAGPTLLLSPLHDELCRQAGLRTGSLSLPEDVPVVIVHARHDTLVMLSCRPRHPPHTYLRAARRFRLPIVPGWPRARPI